MDPNVERIVWTEGPDRPDSVNAPWRPVAEATASVRRAFKQDWSAAAWQRITAVADSLRRPPRRGRRSIVEAAAMSVSAALLLLVPSGVLPVWLTAACAVALVTSSWAEVLPERLAPAAPAMRVVAHALLVPIVVGVFVVLFTA